MSRPKKNSRIFTYTDRHGDTLYYADFRDLGGGREALKPTGKVRGRATSDPDVAEVLCGARVAELLKLRNAKARQQPNVALEKKPTPGLKAFAAHHLAEKAKAGKTSVRWLEQLQDRLTLAVEHFGAHRELDAITPADVLAFLDWVGKRKGRRGNKVLSGQSRRHYLNALSGLYKRAQQDEHVPPGFNPAAAIVDKPTGAAEEAAWLEPHEAALLLESARTWTPPDEDRSVPFMNALLATFLLTGGRKAEVLGLQVEDISFERRKITFRPNTYRGLKTKTSMRTVPLWPQLEEILRSHIRTQAIVGGLLFPSPATHGMLVEFMKPLDLIGVRAGWKPGELRSKMFRHSYCSARLQTLDRGAPVATFTVARELGHGGMTLVNRIYGHVGDSPHRAENVEYRLDAIAAVQDEQKRQQFADRLEKLSKVAVAA